MPEPKKPSDETEPKELKNTRPVTTGTDSAPKTPERTATRKPEDDDPEPEQQLWEMKRQRALADASKPIEAAAEAIWSKDPDKEKARKSIQDAYAKAAKKGSDADPDSHGELRARYRRVDIKFVNAASDMLRSRVVPMDKSDREQQSHLTRWIEDNLTAVDGKVRKVLVERKQVNARLNARLGEREKARQSASETTKRWEQAFGRWSAPDKEIAALIASYADRIDQLNADINTGNNRDQAIFSFWFEVAPVHLQLRAEPVDDENAPGVGAIRAALKGFDEDLLTNFRPGKERGDGSLYLIEPEGPENKALKNKRQEILQKWKEAAEKQAVAEANYTARPDAAADLKPRHDKLTGDGWVKGTREALAAPKP